MLGRHVQADVRRALAGFPVVALLGPRQVGKTTLARALQRGLGAARTRYFDLESPADLAKLSDAEAYLDAQRGAAGRRRARGP